MKPIEEIESCKDCPHLNGCAIAKGMAAAGAIIEQRLKEANYRAVLDEFNRRILEGVTAPAGTSIERIIPNWRLVNESCQLAKRQAALIENQQQMAALKKMRENAEAFAKRRHGS